MNIAAVLSAGKGTRLGADMPKQFLSVGGMPIIIRSVKAFLDCGKIDFCVVASGADYKEYTEELLQKYFPNDRRLRVITGGESRGDTLFKIVEYIKSTFTTDDCVLLTHDAVRPFVTKRIIEENIFYCEKYGAVNTCVKAVDTVLHSSDGKFLDGTLDRSTLWNAQTPQTFNAKKLYDLICNMDREKFLSLTDGASVFLASDEPVYIVEGEPFNIKITYKDDLKRAENILSDITDL